MNTFGSRLKDARRKAGLTQKEVSAKVGLSQSLLSELENDEYPTSGYITQLAHLYRVNARWLAEGKGPREVPVVELLDDVDMAEMLRRYDAQDEATKALIRQLLLQEGEPRPSWMTNGVAVAIDNVRQLVREQIELAARLELEAKRRG